MNSTVVFSGESRTIWLSIVAAFRSGLGATVESWAYDVAETQTLVSTAMQTRQSENRGFLADGDIDTGSCGMENPESPHGSRKLPTWRRWPGVNLP
jgi:hypothetical protein